MEDNFTMEIVVILSTWTFNDSGKIIPHHQWVMIVYDRTDTIIIGSRHARTGDAMAFPVPTREHVLSMCFDEYDSSLSCSTIGDRNTTTIQTKEICREFNELGN